MIEIPENLKEAIIKSEKIFLSAGPLIIISDVSKQLQELIQDAGIACHIISFKKLLSESNTIGHKIFLCGDVNFKEIPSFLRGMQSDSNNESVENLTFKSPWVVIRVSQEKSGDLTFESLNSCDIDDTNLSITHSSWAVTGAAEIRFLQNKTYKVSPSNLIHHGDTSREIDLDSDMEFIN